MRCCRARADLTQDLTRLQTLGVKELRSQFTNEDEALNDAIESAKNPIETLKELRSQFSDEDEDLVKAIDLAKRTIETLKEEVARCTESSAVGKKRLEAKMHILKAQLDHHGLNRDLFNAAAFKFVTLDRSHDRDEETKAKLRAIIKLFRTITRSLHMMCQAPPPREDLRTWLETHPKLGLFLGLAGGSVVGGLGGWAAALAISEGIGGLGGWAAAVSIAEGVVTAIGAGLSGGVAVSVAMGAAGGAVLVVGVLGLYLLYKKHLNATPPSPDAAEAQHFEKIEALLKALKDIPFTAQDIAEIENLYQQMFAPTSMQSGLHECLVCHEELRSCDAVSASGCKHHFAHRGCYAKWAMTSGRKECMVCSSAR